MATFSDYLAVLESQIRKPIAKVEFLRYVDETPYAEITGDIDNGGGSLNIQNQNGVRRTIDMTLINVSGDYLPSPDTIWLRQKIRVFLGFEIDGDDYFIQQGIFVLDNPTTVSNFSEKKIDIRGIDKFALADGTLGGESDGIYQVPVGTNILTAIQDLLQPSLAAQQEVLYDPIEPILHQSYSSVTTTYTIEKETGTPLGEIITELAAMVSANVYYNAQGQLVFEPDFDDNTKASIYDFGETEFNYQGATNEYKFNEVYNAVLVVGDNFEGAIYDSLVENEDLQSPTSIPNVGFRRVLTINDSNIYSTALATERAEYELKKVTNVLNSISIKSIPMYHLDVDNVITLTDSSLGLNRERFLIESVSLPISTSGSMSIRVAKTVTI